MNAPVRMMVNGSSAWAGLVATGWGYSFYVRPAQDGDQETIAEFFDYSRPEDLRFRFLTLAARAAAPGVHEWRAMDHRESFLAFEEDGSLIGAAMLVTDNGGDHAEVAVAVRPAARGRGVGLALLDHVATFARERGVRRLNCAEDASELSGEEAGLGFAAWRRSGRTGEVVLERRLG